MTIKAKLGQIYQQNDALETILRFPLSAKVAYQMAKMIRQISDEIAIVEKQRTSLIEKYGEDYVPDGAPEGTPTQKKVKKEKS